MGNIVSSVILNVLEHYAHFFTIFTESRPSHIKNGSILFLCILYQKELVNIAQELDGSGVVKVKKFVSKIKLNYFRSKKLKYFQILCEIDEFSMLKYELFMLKFTRGVFRNFGPWVPNFCHC